MTKQEIRAAIIRHLRESTTPVRWTATEIDHYIDDGYRDLAERTGAIVGERLLVCGSGVHFISLPRDILFPIAIVDDATGEAVDPVHWTYIEDMDSDWLEKNASRPQVFAAFGLFELSLYPAYGATGTLRGTFAICPETLALDTDEPDLPPEYHAALVHYGSYRCLLKNADGPRLGRALRQLGYFNDYVEGLDTWADGRHEGILMSIYGDRLRVVEAQ